MTLRGSLGLMLALLWGCALHNETLPPIATPLQIASDRPSAEARVYVSDPLDDAVEVYRALGRNRAPIAIIKDGIHGPAGLAVDPGGDLYVANTTSNTVTEYRRTGSTPVATYSQGVLGPVAVAIDDAGTLYVANFDSFAQSVLEFAKGSTSPSTIISAPCGCYPIGLTVDSKANLFVAYDNFFEQTVLYQYAQGSTYPVAVNLQLGTTRWETAGLLFDKRANLLVGNATLPGIQVFPPGAEKPRRLFGKRGSPRFLQFDQSESSLFVTDTTRGVVEEYRYPKIKLTDVISTGLRSAYGVAVSPRAPL